MDRKKVEQRNGKARKAFNMVEKRTYISPEYDMVLGNEEISSTGPLVIARLKLKNADKKGTLPEFLFRWDEKDNHLDIDALDTSKKRQILFRNGNTEYYGHRPTRISTSPRIFQIEIAWSGNKVYSGEFGFSLGRDVEAKTAIGIKTSISISSGKSPD
ncbi:MAG: hypothetical protein PHY18_04075 [Dehalococcoidales bacterium]|nr:hypothetical protein [Dehalococcoidales bacterium]